MIYFKKTAMAVLALSNAVVFAGTMGPVCMVGNVSVPCASTAWEFGAHALYLKPSYSGYLDSISFFSGSSVGNAVQTTSGSITTNVTNTNIVDNSLAWTWAFNLEAAYHFNTGNDLNLNWYHLSHNKTDYNWSDSKDNFTVPPPEHTSDNYQSSVEPSWDAVNLELGQHVDFSEHKKIRFHGGVQYARIHTGIQSARMSTVIAEGAITDSTVGYGNLGLTYNGFGPRVGADMSYSLVRGLVVYANGATAMLAGKSNLTSAGTISATSITPSTITNSIYTTNQGHKTIVPELEGKL